MNESPTPPEQSPDWRAVLRKKNKFALAGIILVAILGVLIVLTIIRTMGMSDGATGLMAPEYYGASSRASMDAVSYESDMGLSYDESIAPGMPPTPYPDTNPGSYTEETYEIRSISATYKTAAYTDVADAIESWKPRDDVVFERSDRGETYASYLFKVERDTAEAIVDELVRLGATDLSEQKTVVRKQLLDYTSQLDLLERKEALLLETLEGVRVAYDELIQLSKEAQDVETLAKVIDGKLKYIESLSQQRLRVASQIEQIARQRSELEDRIAYVYFNVSVQRYRAVDMDAIKDSWVRGVQKVVSEANMTLQALSLGLVSLVLTIANYLVRFLILFLVILVVGKFVWRTSRRFWKA
jgi:hypothetical protein